MQKSANAPLYLIENFNSGLLDGIPKKRYTLTKSGEMVLSEQWTYNENGELVGRLADGKIWRRANRKEITEDATTHELIWSKEFDSSGRIERFVINQKKYVFRYANKKVNLKILDKNDNLLSEHTLDEAELSEIFF
jgi:hypothetical protein